PGRHAASFFLSSRRRHTRFSRDWSSDVCSSDLWPGMGLLLVNAVNSRDYPVIMCATLIVGACVIAVNLLTDIAYAAVDPRIKVRSEERRVGKARRSGWVRQRL